MPNKDPILKILTEVYKVHKKKDYVLRVKLLSRNEVKYLLGVRRELDAIYKTYYLFKEFGRKGEK